MTSVLPGYFLTLSEQTTGSRPQNLKFRLSGNEYGKITVDAIF